jgi:signal transduction histidine kinase
MRWFRGISGMSIKTKLIMGVALVHLVLMTIFVLDMVQRQRVFLLQEANTVAIKQARLTAAAAASWVLSDDLSGMEEVLETSRHDDSPLRYALIADPDGLVLAHTDHHLAGKYLTDKMSLEALNSAYKPKVWHTDSQTIHASAPIVVGKRTIGVVLLGLNTAPTYAHLQYVSRSGFLYTLVAIGAGTLFAWLLARYILRQLSLLLAGVDRLRDDRLDLSIPIIHNDEIGRVGQALNRAMAALRHSRDAIEREVAERRRAEQDIRYLSQKLIGSSEEERKRIGHDLHDELGQMITSFQFGLQSMAGMLAHDAEKAIRLCGRLALQAEKMGEAIHRIASFLWPATLEHLGLAVAIRSYLDEVNQSLPQLRISFTTNLDKRLSPHLELVCFRIVQEAVSNVTRHSSADSLDLRLLARDGWLSLEIHDDGGGFSPQDESEHMCAKGGGIGLLGMRERAESLGGSLRVESAPGQGCRLVARIPLHEGDPAG